MEYQIILFKKIIKEITPIKKKVENVPAKKRVAAYARVSTEQDEQLHSLQVQRDYYENYIKSNPDWELVNIYYDEGITGTSLKRRKGFNQMITDALDGKIDVILVKSVSRFARNTIDALQTTRDLKLNEYLYSLKKKTLIVWILKVNSCLHSSALSLRKNLNQYPIILNGQLETDISMANSQCILSIYWVLRKHQLVKL